MLAVLCTQISSATMYLYSSHMSLQSIGEQRSLISVTASSNWKMLMMTASYGRRRPWTIDIGHLNEMSSYTCRLKQQKQQISGAGVCFYGRSCLMESLTSITDSQYQRSR